MKLALSLVLIPLADAAINAAPGNGWFGGRGLALVVKKAKGNDFSYVTRDGGDDSASFYGDAPKGGTFFRNTVKEVEGKVKKDADDSATKKIRGHIVGAPPVFPLSVAKVKGGSNGNGEDENNKFHIGPFWESKLFKEGGLGFLFGAGTAACVRKVNMNAAYAVGGVCVAAQYISRSDIFGCGGKLGWPKLDDDMLRESERENCKCLWRAGRMFKDTVTHSLPTVEGYALGLGAGLKVPLP